MKRIADTTVMSVGIIVGYLFTLVILVPMLENILFN